MKQDKLQKLFESIDIQYYYFNCAVPDLPENPYYQPYVYLLLKNNVVVYVGQTFTPAKRMKQHRLTKDFDCCIFMDIGLKSIRVKHENIFGESYTKYYFLQSLFEQYLIDVYQTHKIENGNKLRFQIDNIIGAWLYDGTHSRIIDSRTRSWKTH